MPNDSTPNDAKATSPLPGSRARPEPKTVPPAGASSGDAKSTLPLSATPDTHAGNTRPTLPLPGAAPAPLDPGPAGLPAKVGRFVVREHLGSGAFGDVYRAHDPQLDREVAVKVAKPGTLDTPERAARFLREAKSAANLRHPNIVPLYETGRDGDRLFIASAFIAGRTLEAVIHDATETGQRLSPQDAARIVRKLADALAYAHRQGIVHRDVKPANVIMDDRGEPLLLDFGLAARAEAGEEKLSDDGQALGTPAYMAPEQAEGGGVAASDQYSLGCTLYELLTGRTPFAGGPAQQLFLHKTQPAPSVRKARRDTPRDLGVICLKCLEKAPADRYPTAKALADDLNRYLRHEPINARPAGPVERAYKWARRNKAAATAVAIGATAAVAIVGLVATWISKLAVEEKQSKTENKAKLDEGLRAVASIAAQVWASAQDHYAAQEQAELAASGLYFSQMRDVGRLWKTEPSIGAKQLANTNNCPDRLREVCWGVLARLCREYLTLTGQPGTALAVSRDGTIVALGTAGNDAAVHLLDADTGRLRKKLAGHTDKVAAVAFAAAADELASASEDGTVRLWDAATFTARTTLKAGTPLQSVALAPDAKWVAAGPRGQALDTTKRPTKIKLWRLTGAVEPAPTELIGHEGPIWALATSPDGETLASASSDGTVRLWDTATGNCKSVMNHGGWVLAIAFAADGKSLASGNANGMLRVWSLDGKEERAWQAPGTQSLTFTPDGTLAGAHETVSAGRPNQVMLWDAKAGKLKVSLDLTNSRILCLASAAKGRALVAADEGGTVRFWNASPTEEDLVVPAYRGKGLLSPEAGYAVAYSPSGPEIATGGGVPRGLFNGEVKLWDARTGEPRRVLGTHKGKVLTVAYSPDGGTLVSGAADGSVKVWDTKTGAERAAYRGNAEEIRCVAVANTKRLAASVGKDRVVCVWDLDTGNEKFRMEGHENIVMAAVFAPDDAVLYTASHDKTIRLWDVRNGKERARWVAPDRVVALAMSANGRTLYAGGDNSHVQTWSVERGELLATSIGHTKAVYGIAASRNGRTLASGSADGTVRLWEQDGMREIITLTPVAISVMGLPYEVKGLAFSPDGKALAGIGTDGKLRIWR